MQNNQNNTVYDQIVAAVQRHAERRSDRSPSLVPQIEEGIRKQRLQQEGWMKTLGNPQLTEDIRSEILVQYSESKGILKDLESQLQELKIKETLTPEKIAVEEINSRIARLPELMASVNPTQANIELSLHFDNIRCFAEGEISIRISKIAFLANSSEWAEELREDVPASSEENASPTTLFKASPRLRNRREHKEIGVDSIDRQLYEFARDPNRFVGISDEWFWTHKLQYVKAPCWYEAHAEEVYALYSKGNTSLTKLAEHFQMCKPTVHQALKLARRNRGESETKTRKPRKPRAA